MKKKVAKTTEKVTQVLNQAKESLKLLEVFEKEALAKARTMIPDAQTRKRMTNDRILASLKKLGVVTRSEVETLEARIAKLESDLAALAEKQTAPRRKSASSSASAETAPTA